MNRTLLALSLISLTACGEPETGTIRPQLAFVISEETGLTNARDLTVDASGNVFVFDYDDYLIYKFNPAGEALGTFGGPAGEEGGFQHLMAIRALGDSLLALDAGALSVFDLSGRSMRHRPFTDTITCDLPRLHHSGEWAGGWIIQETAEKALTYRGADGREQARVDGYRLGELFPGVEPGVRFFIRTTQARSYLYDFLPDGRLAWAASDKLEVRIRDGGENDPVYAAEGLPLPFPAEEVRALREQQARLGPPLFMNVPENYQLIHHLLADETGDLWIYVMSRERTGFLLLSDRGRELGFYTLDADFDPIAARVTAAGGRLYFLVVERDETKIYVADRP
jgi:hypothetical protein